MFPNIEFVDTSERTELTQQPNSNLDILLQYECSDVKCHNEVLMLQFVNLWINTSNRRECYIG